MEVKVEIGLSKGLENIMNRFINAIEGVTALSNASKSSSGDQAAPADIEEEVSSAQVTRVKAKVETVSDIEMVQPVETAPEVTEDADTAVDYPALRKEIKKLGIKLVQAKKQSEVKILTAKYGHTKIDELSDEQLEAYLKELKEI